MRAKRSVEQDFFNRFLPHALLKQRYVLVCCQIGVLEGSDSSDALFHTIDLYLYCLSGSAKRTIRVIRYEVKSNFKKKSDKHEWTILNDLYLEFNHMF